MPRIGIVGAGPGGISLARLLTEEGHADVTVLERNNRVGGKSLTVHHEGIGHEMGTCYVADGYKRTKKWMKEAGMKEHPLLHHAIHADGKLIHRADAGFLKIDYVALVDADTLAPLDAPADEMRLIAAATIGSTRLIDNVRVISDTVGETGSPRR